MIFDILRFNTFATDLLEKDDSMEGKELKEMSLLEYLDKEGYSKPFRDNYLIVRPSFLVPRSDNSAHDSSDMEHQTKCLYPPFPRPNTHPIHAQSSSPASDFPTRMAYHPRWCEKVHRKSHLEDKRDLLEYTGDSGYADRGQEHVTRPWEGRYRESDCDEFEG